jgi:UDP-2-acetamido-2,6-beta-L-arabino-hexul-4-ose reductase
MKELEIKTDDRGSLVTAFTLPNDGQIFYVRVNPNKKRGEHFHLFKSEKFLVIDGDAVINLRKVGSYDIRKIKVSGEKPTLVDINPNVTHNIVAGKFGCTLLVWCDEVFDDKQPDTYGEEV